MKGKTIILTGGLVALVALSSSGQLAVSTKPVDLNPQPTANREIGLGQRLKQKQQQLSVQSMIAIPTAADTLSKIMDEVSTGKIPIEIYPPGMLEHLKEMGDQPMYSLETFDPYASALRAGDKANMVWMDAVFTMGSPTSEAERGSGEVQHTVILTSGFFMSKYEVTQGEYLDVMGNNPSYYTSANGYTDDMNRPVEQVTWTQATNYCYQLTLRELAAGRIQSGWAYRLPTEAEWEYSCRAGTTTAFSFGNSISSGMENFDGHHEYNSSTGSTYNGGGDYPQQPVTVGSYSANAYGLFDMQGNVSEWCSDYSGALTSDSAIDPQGPTSGTSRVVRGGFFRTWGYACRAAIRASLNPSTSQDSTGFRTVLAPTTAPWSTAITTTPSQPGYGICPVLQSGKDSLIVVTHGWSLRVPLVGSPPTSVPWVDNMTSAIGTYLSNHGLNNWQVFGYKWLEHSWTYTPNDALNNAKQEGISLGNSIVQQGWSHVHLIAHSAGAALIQSACERIKDLAPSIVVHCTFLDAYVGTDYSGLANYGNRANWSDSYFSHDGLTGGELWPLTEGVFSYSYNVNVTQLDPNKVGSTKFRSSQTGQMETCYKTLSSHEWPDDFYQNTITGSVSSEYAGFGFPLSEEGGNWSYALANYTVGNTTPQQLGTPDPTCTTDIQINPPSYLNTVPDFTQWPTIQSDTGTIQKYMDHLNLLSGSPAWLATVVTSTNTLNVVSFDAQFTSSSGSQGLLTVLWDDQTIGSLDERTTSGLRHYQFTFPNAEANSTHVLGLRLDPFTNIQSTITITNVVLNHVGPKTPFSLAVTTNAPVNGSLVYQLTGEANFTYSVQASSDFFNWTNIASLANTNGAVLFYDPNAASYQMRFYRASTP